ncbi:MAG: hypothetical protein CSA50_06320 [Gammaproteobacteria bacterium]|nr:MAG: hypothetical protein CSA50_06320 [Gammaproteobacteria bacterium]
MTLRLLSLFFLVHLFIIGCADGNAPSSGARNTENSFPPQSDEPFETTDDSNRQANPEVNEVVVSVQATEGMQASWNRSLFNVLTPARAYAFRGQQAIKVRHLSVHRVTRALTITSSGSIKLDYSTRENADDTYSILFNHAPSIPNRMDVLIRAELDNGTLLWAPLLNNKSTIKVNIISTYLIESLFRAINHLGLNLADLTPCGTEYGCENQNEARLLIWSEIAQGAQHFDTLIPGNLSASEAKTFLANESDFQAFVESGIDSVLAKGFVDAISTQLDFADILDTQTTEYNTVFFSLGLSQREPERSDFGSVLFNRVSTSTSARLKDGSTEYSYPTLTETSLKTTVTTHSLFGDLPYTRLSLSQPNNRVFIANENTDNEINSFSSEPANSYLNTSGFLNVGQTPYQTITGKGSDSVRGWLTNPLLVRLYGGTEHSYLLAAPASTGRIYDLTELGNDKYRRNQVLENTFEFNYMLHLQANLEQADLIAASDGKTYGSITMEQRLDATSDTPLTFSVALSQWQISQGSIASGPATTVIPGFYKKLRGARDRQQAARPMIASSPDTFTLQLEPAISKVYDPAAKDIVGKNLGRVQLLDSGTEYAVGATNPEAQTMAFVRSSTNSQGVILVTEIDRSIDSLRNREYRIQGHTLAIHPNANELTSYDGSSLSIDDNGIATLHLTTASVAQDITTMKVTNPGKKQTLSPATGLTSVAEGLLQISFGEVAGQPFVVQGVISKNSETLSLLVQHGDNIGLLLGMQNLSLPRS